MLRTSLLCLLCLVFIGCKKDSEKYLKKAEILIEEGKVQKAIRYLEKYIINDSIKPYKKPSVRLKLAKLYLEHDLKNDNILILLEEAGENDVYEAYALLSLLYSTGNIVASDPSKAFQYIQKASSNGDHNYLSTLGKYLFKGYGVVKNTGMAREYFLEAAENGNIEAANYLCELYTLEEHEMQSSELASKYCQIAVNHELPRAIHAVNLYQIKSDENSVIALIKNASKQWVPSHLALVKELMKGAFEKYRNEIFQLFDLSLNNTEDEFYEDINELKAFYFRYWKRYPNEADKKLALKCLNEAREAQQAMAMTDWAILNLDKQNKVARKLLKLAAQLKEPNANWILGKLYLNSGSGFSRDESAALKHLSAACSSKIVTSCYTLGILLSESYEIPRDLNSAFRHLSYAAFNKHKDALKKALNLSRLNPNLADPTKLEKLKKMAANTGLDYLQLSSPTNRPWKTLLERSKQTEDRAEKSKLLKLSKKSLSKELTQGFELKYRQHQIEHELFQLQINSDPFDTFSNMNNCWHLLQISQATKELNDFFEYSGVKINWDENLKRLEMLQQSLKLHNKLLAKRVYEDSYQFWNANFGLLDEYLSALISYRTAVKTLTGPSLDQFEKMLRRERSELALKLASIDHELKRFEACKKWINKAKKDDHPIHNLVQGRMLISVQMDQRNDSLAWELLFDSANKSPHVDSKYSYPLPGGKAESLLLLSKMVASRRSPKKYWGKKNEYMFLKAACHFQPRYVHLLKQLSQKIDPRLALQAEKLAYRWIKSSNKQ